MSDSSLVLSTSFSLSSNFSLNYDNFSLFFDDLFINIIKSSIQDINFSRMPVQFFDQNIPGSFKDDKESSVSDGQVFA